MSESNSIFDLKDQQRLEKTMEIRERAINELTEKGIPECTDDRKFLVSMLDGLDRVVLSKSKLKIEDASNKTQQQSQAIIGDLLLRISEKKIIANTTGVPPVLDPEIKTGGIVPDEMTTGVQSMNYESFMGSNQTSEPLVRNDR